MCKGFKQITNDFFESDYWRQSRTYNDCEAVLDIISQVRFEASEHTARIGGREVTWGQAQWPASVRFLAARWKWTERRVRTFFASLKRRGVITTDDSQGVNIVTLKKYLVIKSDTENDTVNDTDNKLNISRIVHLVTQQVTQEMTQGEAKYNEERHSSDTKHNNGKNIEHPPLSPKGETSFDWSLLPEDFKPIAEEWLAYKREKKQTYKPRGFKVFCKNLLSLSGNDPTKARLIIEQSMRNNYSGIFELKRTNYEATSANRQNTTNGTDIYQQTVNVVNSFDESD